VAWATWGHAPPLGGRSRRASELPAAALFCTLPCGRRVGVRSMKTAKKNSQSRAGGWISRMLLGLVALIAWGGNSRLAQAAEVDGFYISGSAGFVWGMQSTHEWASECPVVTPASELVGQQLGFSEWKSKCSTAPPLGVMVEGRLGLRFKYIGLEGFLLGSGDWSSGVLEDEPPIPIPEYARKMYIGRLGGGPGIGIRFMTQPKPVQLTLGIGGGGVARFVFSNVSSLDGSSESYLAPMARADLTFVFAKHFMLGIMGWAEFSDRVRIRPDLSSLGLPAAPGGTEVLRGLDEVVVFAGTQYYLAPYLGIQFGK
jgi:hypothetical protein